jgi:hypothetical protein
LIDIDGNGCFSQQRSKILDILVHNKCEEAALPSFENAF